MTHDDDPDPFPWTDAWRWNPNDPEPDVCCEDCDLTYGCIDCGEEPLLYDNEEDIPLSPFPVEVRVNTEHGELVWTHHDIRVYRDGVRGTWSGSERAVSLADTLERDGSSVGLVLLVMTGPSGVIPDIGWLLV